MCSGLLWRFTFRLIVCCTSLCSGCDFGSVTSLVADHISSFVKRRCGGGMKAWMFSTSPAVVLMAPSIVIMARHWAVWTRFVNLMDPVRFVCAWLVLWGNTYHTSAV